MVPAGGAATITVEVPVRSVVVAIVKPVPEGVPAEHEYTNESVVPTSAVVAHESFAVGAFPALEHCQLTMQLPERTGCQLPVLHVLGAGCCGCVEHCSCVEGVHGLGCAGGVGAMAFVLP